MAGALEADLAALGLAADDVDVVVLTHLHQDHVGWLSMPGSGRPTFGRARHIVSGPEWAAARDGEMAPYVRDALGPVQAAGRLDVDGAPPGAMRLVPLPGHTSGHTGVLVEGDTGLLLLGGDGQVIDPAAVALVPGHHRRHDFALTHANQE